MTPAEATIYGLAAGFAATVLLSGLARIPAVKPLATQSSLDRPPDLPEPMSPAAVLAQSSGPGPEGVAGLFAAKVASGMFGRDLAGRTRPWGRVVHFAYGSLWGMVYGILQNRRPRRPELAGASHGLLVWAFGPGLLVPAMKLTPPPASASRMQLTLGLAGHIAYGITIATLFNRLSHTGAADEPVHVRHGNRVQ